MEFEEKNLVEEERKQKILDAEKHRQRLIEAKHKSDWLRNHQYQVEALAEYNYSGIYNDMAGMQEKSMHRVKAVDEGDKF